ncbi:MAG: hypothetical protein ABSA75_02680 [Candidatus Bathyarchaeia archaeon]|jgi:hypothetical protein
MSELEKVIAEDLKAAVAAFKDDSYDTANVLANRIMSNAIFGQNSKIFLPGFFLKDVAFTFGILKARSSSMAFSTAKSHGFTFVDSLSKQLPTIDEKELWDRFFSYSEKMRSFESTDWENKSYSVNIKFTSESFKWLLTYLQQNKSALLDPRNFLIKGMINEMGRVYKAHSAELKDFASLNLIIALDRDYDYICRISNGPNLRSIDEEEVKKFIFPTVDKILSLSVQEFKIEDVDLLLWDLVRKWREYFILYGELLSPAIALQKGIEIPEELKKKLSDSLTKTLEKQM